MKSVLVNYEHPDTDPNCGGGGEVSRQLQNGLKARGHQVRIVTDGVENADDWTLRGPPTRGHWSTFPARTYPHLRNLVEWADVVNSHFSLPSGLMLPRLCNATDTPLAVTCMGADVYDPTRFGLVRPVADTVNRYILDQADAVIAPSMDMVKRVEGKYGIDCRLIHYGIDVDEWNWSAHELHEPVRIHSVCRLVERKNLKTAIEAVATLRQSGIDATYTIVGRGPKLDAIQELKFENDYSWLHPVGYAENLEQEYGSHDIFFLPSEHEAFGVVFLEALASGLPVVTSPNGGQRDIVSDGVGLAAPALGDGGALLEFSDDVKMYADMLSQVIFNYDEYQRATRGYVESEFSLAQMVDQYERLFQELQS